jgi:prevent-host-death family protein
MKAVRLTEAETSLSALVDAAENGESTMITRNGKPAAVISPVSSTAGRRDFSVEENRRFVEHLMKFPGGIEFERNMQPSREIDL